MRKNYVTITIEKGEKDKALNSLDRFQLYVDTGTHLGECKEVSGGICKLDAIYGKIQNGKITYNLAYSKYE